MSILIKGMDMLKDGTYTSNIHVKGGKAILDNPIGLGYFELVEVVHGEWMIDEEYVSTSPTRGRKTHVITWACSNCLRSNGRRKTNFCPNCGADMRGGDAK